MLKNTARAAGALILLWMPAAPQSTVRLNQIQVIGTHNSYHERLAPGEFASFRKRDPQTAERLSYRHPPLDLQFSSGVRQIELDVWADTRGGLFASPAGLRIAAQDGASGDPPFDPAGLMRKPGFKVLHMQDVDYRSTCPTFVDCLGVVRRWSKAHPGHLPIFILVENKEEQPRPQIQVAPEKFTAALFDALDAEVLKVFERGEILTPDDVRGRRASLREAVRKDGWPPLDKVRGKVVFMLDREDATPVYLEGHPRLRGRLMFPNADPASPEAGFVKLNEPLKESGLITRLVKEGFLIRTRTDSEQKEPLAGDTQRRDVAMASGAQMLSTDFAFNWRHPATGYSVSFAEGAVARCNPVLKPKGCEAAKLEKTW